MRYQLSAQGWSIGQFLLPSGLIIDSSQPDYAGLTAGKIPPIDACPLDAEALQVMLNNYDSMHHHRIRRDLAT